MLQPYLAGRLLKDPLLNSQGIFARCLITWPPSLAGQRFYQPVDLTQDISLKRYTQRITDLLQRPWAIDSDGALHPKTLPLRSLVPYDPAPPRPRTTCYGLPASLRYWKTAT
nr:DUF3987 domain-containing protein [Pseudomonas frederiksbergensis]